MSKVRSFKFWLATAAGIVCSILVVSRIASFIHIFGEHAGVVLTQGEVFEAYTSDLNSKQAFVPKIIHRIFHNWTDPNNEALPLKWEANRQSCIDLNPGWESWVSYWVDQSNSKLSLMLRLKLWTARTSRDFIEREYPWFLTTYDSYKFPIQRID